MATNRSSYSALARLEAMRQNDAGLMVNDMSQGSDLSGWNDDRTPVGQTTQVRQPTQDPREVDLGMADAANEQKLNRTKDRGALTVFNDLLGNFLGYETRQDYLDRDAEIEAGKSVLSEQAAQAAVKAAAIETGHVNGAEEDYKAFEEMAMNVSPANEEDRVQIANLTIARRQIDNMIANPATREEGYKARAEHDLRWSNFQIANETQMTARYQWGQEQKVREATLAETQRDNRAKLAETVRANKASEAAARDTAQRAKSDAYAQQYYKTSHEPWQKIENDRVQVKALLEEYYRTGDGALLTQATALTIRMAQSGTQTEGDVKRLSTDVLSSSEQLKAAGLAARGVGSPALADQLWSTQNAIGEANDGNRQRAYAAADSYADANGIPKQGLQYFAPQAREWGEGTKPQLNPEVATQGNAYDYAIGGMKILGEMGSQLLTPVGEAVGGLVGTAIPITKGLNP